MHRWRDRVEAGEELAKALTDFTDQKAVIYGLPRGGVVLAAEVAKNVGAPLSVIIARKIGHPFNPEYAIGAVTETGEPVINEYESADISKDWLKKEVLRQREEAARRRKIYLSSAKPISAKGKIGVLVDDGVATGYTLKAAIKELSAQKPKKIVVAVPVIPVDTAAEIELEADRLIALKRDENYRGTVGAYYNYFDQTDDNEVVDLLAGSDD